MTCLRDSCGAEADYPLCWECSKRLRDIALGIKAVIPELQTQVTKQGVGAPSTGGSGTRTWVLPFDAGASTTFDDLVSTLAAWLADDHGLKTQGMDKLPKARLLADWHIDHAIEQARRPDAPQLFDELEYALRKSVQAIGRRESRVWLGTCECGRPVQAYASNRFTACECGQVYNVAGSREKIRQMGAEQLVTAKQASDLGELHGKQLKPATILKWHQRKNKDNKPKLESRGYADTGALLFRLGDILDLAKDGT